MIRKSKPQKKYTAQDAWTLGRLKRETAKDLQKAVRMEAADKNGVCQCVTCPNRGHYKTFHAGHFVSGRGNGILFDERNLAPQCPRCNFYMGGNQESYTQYMLEQHSQEVIDEIRRNRNRVVKFTREQLMIMRAGYRARWKAVEKSFKEAA